MASGIGRNLVIDAERYERNPEEEREMREAIGEFATVLTDQDSLLDEESREVFETLPIENDEAPQFERRYLFSVGTAKNAAIVLSGAAIVGGVAAIPVIGTGLVAPTGFVVLNAIKNSKAFKELSDTVSEKIDDVAEVKWEELPMQGLEKFYTFVLDNEKVLKRIAGSSKSMKWLHDVIDWLKDRSDSQIEDGKT
ncbi:MAG: hypothetical protein HRT80_14955 [Henriciella sp.]|nr:hypothetical protein [Henriciella sp.]